jgi:hypothetical protein
MQRLKVKKENSERPANLWELMSVTQRFVAVHAHSI